ncbi:MULTISPECIES: MATE family efflux transporter [unclassified Streptomyces]|uniref:MATE family efflux transporter n=1 Tax=unclassified Streptomyces TaxID=2593676 RepID=UPI0003717B9E|nr:MULTISPECIES: MATE family efflux transporter [unclassified Streptomyces]
MSTTPDIRTASARSAVLSPAATRWSLLGLGIPVYLELLSGVVAGVIDTIWVSRLGEAAVGAVAVATTLENVLLGVILMANVGATVMIADAIGAKRRAEVPVIMGAVRVLWLVITPVVAVGGFLLREPIARLLVGGEGDVLRLTVQFFAISFPGIAVFFAQNVVDGVFKGTGDTRTPMRTAILANALILVLDPLLIYGVGPLPHLGVRGAALGMLLGRAIALCVSLTILRRRRLTDVGDAEPTGLRLWGALRRLLNIGLPASGDFVLRMGISMTLVGIVARFGEDPLAAYGIGFKVLFFVTMAFYAVRQAGSILTARTRGAGESAESMIGRQSAVLATLVGAGAGFLLAVGGRFLMGLFSDAPGVVDSGGVLFWYLFPYLLLLAGVVGLGGVFTGGGRSRALFWVTLLGAVVQIPLAFALSSWSVLGVEGVWLSMIVGTGAQYAMSYALFRRYFAENG